MPDRARVQVAIVDYGMGNLFSVTRACEHVGIRATITSSRQEILYADAVILPGVGAFGDAMASLNRLDLVSPLRDFALSQKPMIGICLGMQLLMTESSEFGRRRGLGIIDGPVVGFANPVGSCRMLKVPQVGWNRIFRRPDNQVLVDGDTSAGDPWWDSPLAGLSEGEFMYFVHSFFAKPEDFRSVLSISRYGDVEFCSSLKHHNVFACQFHPERSGPWGLQIYHNLASLVKDSAKNQTRTVGDRNAKSRV